MRCLPVVSNVGLPVGRATSGAAVLCVIAFMFVGAGCIVQEIRDELVLVNGQLEGVKRSLEKLDVTNTRLDETNGALKVTNTMLAGVQEQTDPLPAIGESLTRMDAHLTSLRKTVEKLDGVIPFLDLGGDAPVEEVAAQAVKGGGETAAGAVAQGRAEGKAEGKDETQAEAGGPSARVGAEASDNEGTQAVKESKGPAKGDSLVGTWQLVYPERSAALVLRSDGRYIVAKSATLVPMGVPRKQQGEWKRGSERGIVEFTAGAETPSSLIKSWRLTVVAQTARSLTTMDGGDLLVWVRP